DYVVRSTRPVLVHLLPTWLHYLAHMVDAGFFLLREAVFAIVCSGRACYKLPDTIYLLVEVQSPTRENFFAIIAISVTICIVKLDADLSELVLVIWVVHHVTDPFGVGFITFICIDNGRTIRTLFRRIR